METKNMISSCSESKDVHAIKYKMLKAKERCMTYFRSLHSHLQVLSKEDLKGTRIEHGFKRAFMSLFGQDNETFTNQLQKQLDKDEFQEEGSMEAFWFRETLLQHMGNVKKSVAERTRHQRQYDRRANKRQIQTQESKVDTGKAVDADLVVTKSSGTESEVQDTSSRSGNDTDNDDAEIRPIYDEEPMAETYEELYDYIKKTRVQTKDHIDSLIVQLNNKSTDNVDLKAQIQEKVFAIAALKNELRKLKGNSVDTKRESDFAKPDHMIAFSESRNSFKNMLRFSSNDMVHNYYLEEAKKKTQEKDRNSKSSVMHSTRLQHTTNDHKQKTRSNNQITRSLPISKSSCVMSNVVPLVDHSRNSSPFLDSKHFVYSTCHKCIFNANHDAGIIKLLKEVNSCAKVKSRKIRNNNKPVEQKSHTQKPSRQIFTGYRFSPNKSSAVYEKTSPRSCLRCKLTGRIFDIVGLRWIPTGKLLDSCTGKVDNEPLHGSNVVISKIHECRQTLDLSVGTSINVQKKQSIDLSAGTSYNVKKENLRVWLLKRMISQKPVL
ncbi:hypothetical protein Tco_0601363 [Tanacetum coccineum]